MSITIGHDATAANFAKLPAGQAMGYASGTPEVDWTAAMWAARPGAVRVWQSPTLAPAACECDVLDYEALAATTADIAPWATGALAAFKAGTRPGQRSPVVYCSRDSLTPAANALTAAGLTGGDVGFGVAIPGEAEAAAIEAVTAASGPFPVHFVQFQWGGDYDTDVFSAAWLAGVSGPRDPARQVGKVHSDTTGGTATVYSVDGGQTWTFRKPAGF